MALLWTSIVITSAISTQICLLILLTVCYHLLCNKPSFDGLHKPVRYYSIISILWFTVTTITATIATLYYDKDLNLPDPDKSMYKYNVATSMTIINLLSWSFGVFALYLLFITRLRRTYRDSEFKISVKIYFILYSLNIILLISQLIEYFMLIAAYYNSLDFDTYSKWSIKLMISAACLHLIISFVLVYMFISRLLRLFVMMSFENIRHFIKSNLQSNDEQDFDKTVLRFNDKQQSILNIMTKHSILSITAIISTLIYFVTMIILNGAFSESVQEESINYYRITLTINAIMFVIDCVVNCICILLTFGFERKFYLCLCGKLDSFCQSLCTKYVKKKIKNEYEKEKNGEDIKSVLIDESISNPMSLNKVRVKTIDI